MEVEVISDRTRCSDRHNGDRRTEAVNEGGAPQKPRSRAAAAMAARAQSCVLTDESQVGADGRITKFDSV